MIKNNNYLDSLPKSLIDDVRSIMENKCKKGCECDKCSCEKEEKGEKEEKNEKEMKEAYNKDSVDKAIASSNRSGKKIGGREGKLIHALLKGREKKPVESDDDKAARLKDNMNKRDNYLKNKYGGLAKIGEEAEQIDEISKKLATDYFHAKQDKARKDLMRGRPTNKRGILLAKAKIEGDAKVPATHTHKEEVDMGQADRTLRKPVRVGNDGKMSHIASLTKAAEKMGHDSYADVPDNKVGKLKSLAKSIRNEEVEQVDEISKKVATSFLDKTEPKIEFMSGPSGKQGHEKGRKLAFSKLARHSTAKVPATNEETEIDEAKKESPIAGTRLVSKHEGKDGHHAEVRYSKDWNEYSVHHYQNGKHMGEGPVSYHGDGKEGREDATDTAEHEVKNYRPKGGSLHKEEAEIDEAKKMKGEDPCWKNYKMVGTKKGKGGKEVPNCVPEETEVKEALVGKQHKLDKNKNGKLDKKDFKMLRKEETSLEEKLNPSMGAAKYIQDFVKSKDPRFQGKTKKERIKMALGAFYGAKNEAVEDQYNDAIDEAYGDKRDYKKHHIYVNGRYIATTTWAKNAKEAEQKFVKAHPEHKNKRITVEKDG